MAVYGTYEGMFVDKIVIFLTMFAYKYAKTVWQIEDLKYKGRDRAHG